MLRRFLAPAAVAMLGVGSAFAQFTDPGANNPEVLLGAAGDPNAGTAATGLYELQNVVTLGGSVIIGISLAVLGFMLVKRIVARAG